MEYRNQDGFERKSGSGENIIPKHSLEIEGIQELSYALEEAINRLRINVSFMGKKVRKIMVTSTFPNEGKSFIAQQLWRRMAEAGIDSVLVDSDLRNSTLADRCRMKTDSKQPMGLSHYLANDCELEDVLYATKTEGAHIIPNLNNVVNPSILFEGDRMKSLLDELTKTHRYVFVDTPPLELASDGQLLGTLCDGVILVVRADSTSKRLVQKSIHQIERSGCQLLGIVLNRAGSKKSSRYYYGKEKYGYGYYRKSDYYGKHAAENAKS